MAVDESVSLPSPPSPRPAARQAAIEAALRKFDGEAAGAPVRERPRRWWSDLNRRPLAGLVTAALIAVVSVPAALVALRDQPTAEAPKPRLKTNFEPARAKDTAAVEPANSEPSAEDHPVAARTPIPLPLEPHTSDARETPAEEKLAAPMAAMAAPAAPPPPPPPPAPPAPEASQQYAEGATADEIVLTGSRIRRPALEKPSAARVAAEREADEVVTADTTNGAYRQFLTRLQAAVRADDRKAVIALVGFPLRVNSAGKSRIYESRRAVERDFDSIFTASVRSAILSQPADRLFSNWKGAMIGNGNVWFDETCVNSSCSRKGPVRITSVNR